MRGREWIWLCRLVIDLGDESMGILITNDEDRVSSIP